MVAFSSTDNVRWGHRSARPAEYSASVRETIASETWKEKERNARHMRRITVTEFKPDWVEMTTHQRDSRQSLVSDSCARRIQQQYIVFVACVMQVANKS